MTQTKIRIDKWLWAVRICKTRVIATDLCKRGKVKIASAKVKPGREVKINDMISVKKDGIEWIYRVVKCIDKRVGAKIAQECLEHLTPQDQLDQLKAVRSAWVPRREKGAGRPTKKDRRDLEKLISPDE